ncbi:MULTISPECIES: hypothetical protein [unclassified Aurantimonas]|uniref:hypothetical protein n=1 Tax=unclassified Aurantimonas TaxID=2638230 RepID=UPI002E19D3B4|nr:MULTISPECIES: hypothetical protein [unclassified Aurantimonas]MEC5291591.1 hypothetical protein [Aurantimonas sp. C2-3-R2]MEC5412675.1 hypothetical protein [Aurantimonas sp. C2-4-R8]
MPETTSGGVLIEATDGHITRGGEFEKRAAFVAAYTLPAGTTGMYADAVGLIVFGHIADPGMPLGIRYQRLQHPDGITALTRVLSEDLYAGKVYAVGEFADGSRHHFYDGTRVVDWFDGRARAQFTVVDGAVAPATKASGRFEVTGGTSSPGVNRVTSIQINGVTITGGPVDHTGNNASTASALAASINGFTSSPNYTASVDGQIVVVTAVATGPAVNGNTIVVNVGGDVTGANLSAMTGGADAQASRLESLSVNGVPIIASGVNWATSDNVTADAIAAAVNGLTSTPDYSATVVDANVNIIAADAGTGPNGYPVTATVSGGLVLAPSTGLQMAQGAAADGGFTPGAFVKTIGSKVYSTSGPNMHYSGIKEPTKWATDTTGAGFIDMSSETSGSEELTALAKYQDFVAVFAERVIQIWVVDPDPANNNQAQVLNNTGTASPRSVTQFGDADLFYLDETGLRSIRARDASNAAATEDIGTPIDTLIAAALIDLTDNERAEINGAIEPRDGRFWLSIKDTVFVFTYFSTAKVSAWTTYKPGFDVERLVPFRRRMFVRSGDVIYAYGGLADTLAYDATVAVARIPYLDANEPTRKKHLTGFDAAADGNWEFYVGMDPDDLTTLDKIGALASTSYNHGSVGLYAEATHFSILAKTTGDGAARLGAMVVHFEGDDDAD